MEIIISSNTSKPIYEQITSQIKGMIMSGELRTGDPIPSMRALAKSIHVSVITVQKAYEDLQRDGFIETTVGRGSFVSARNKDFYQEERQRQAEELFPWDFIDIGVTKRFLRREWERAMEGLVTPNCREACSGCGAAVFGGGICHEN